MNEFITQEQWDRIIDSMQILTDAVASFISKVMENLKWNYDELILSYGTGRVKHLALHSRKARTRKKNIHRMQRQFLQLLWLEGNTKGNR